MRRIIQVLLLSAAIVAPTRTMAATPASATARAVSAEIVGGVRLGVKADTRASSAQIQCVLRMHDEAVADSVQSVIERALSPAELTYLEAFYGNTLSVRFLKAITDKKAGGDKALTAAEWARVEAVQSSPQMAKLRKVTSPKDPEAYATISAELKPMFDACFH